MADFATSPRDADTRDSEFLAPLDAPPSTMAPLFPLGQILKGNLNTYTITKQLYESVFLAVNLRHENAIVKSVQGHWRLQNERDILKRFQSKAPTLRPLIDEIVEPSEPPAIVLKYLDSDLLRESALKRLTRPEIKTVAKCVLKALKVLHEDGFVHTDIKLDNVLVNYGKGAQRFADILLADCGGTVSVDSKFATEGHTIGAAYARSPEVNLNIPWGTATDIWSFGNLILSLLYGGDYHLFNPGIDGVKFGDDQYELTVLKRQHKFFGPFPLSYSEIADPDAVAIIIWVMGQVPGDKRKPFHLVTKREIPAADNKFLLKIMKLDPRDRPTARELLEDEWFTEESEDTRDPQPDESSH